MRGRCRFDRFVEEQPADDALLDAAIHDFEEGLAIDPRNSILAKSLAAALVHRGAAGRDPAALRRAAVIVEETRSRDGQNEAGFLLVRGAIRFEDNDHAGALEDYERARQLQPTNPVCWESLAGLRYSIGFKRRKAGDHDGARESFLEAQREFRGLLEVLPPFDPAWRRRVERFGKLTLWIASTVRHLHGLDASIAFLEESMSRLSTSAVHEELANSLLRRGNGEGALLDDHCRAATHFEIVRSLGGESPHIVASLLYLHAWYRVEGSTPEGIAHLVEKARSIDVDALSDADAINLAWGLLGSRLPGSREEALQTLKRKGLDDPASVAPAFRPEVEALPRGCDR
jgi:tetratricopeptide (TPR) repeat protein